MSSSPRAQHNSSTGYLQYGTPNGQQAPRAGKGGAAISLCATTGVYALYLGSRTTWRHTLQSGPSSPSVQEAIHLQPIFRDGFNGFMRAAESPVHNRKEWTWPWLLGAEIVLAVPENSNRAVLPWTS